MSITASAHSMNVRFPPPPPPRHASGIIMASVIALLDNPAYVRSPILHDKAVKLLLVRRARESEGKKQRLFSVGRKADRLKQRCQVGARAAFTLLFPACEPFHASVMCNRSFSPLFPTLISSGDAGTSQPRGQAFPPTPPLLTHGSPPLPILRSC